MKKRTFAFLSWTFCDKLPTRFPCVLYVQICISYSRCSSSLAMSLPTPTRTVENGRVVIRVRSPGLQPFLPLRDSVNGVGGGGVAGEAGCKGVGKGVNPEVATRERFMAALGTGKGERGPALGNVAAATEHEGKGGGKVGKGSGGGERIRGSGDGGSQPNHGGKAAGVGGKGCGSDDASIPLFNRTYGDAEDFFWQWYDEDHGHTGTFATKGGSQPSVRENFAHTRQRYTNLTSVPSWGHDDPNVPPKVAVLFKNMPNGPVIRGLRASKRLTSWMKVQVQENGSYRSGDVVEALDWMLPPASNSSESIIVILDWFSGHLTEEVAALVRGKGHVLIFHGGGCTPFTQVNDTHLHARLARLLIQIENRWAGAERRRLVGLGQNKTPKMTKEEILTIVQTAWLMIDHARVAHKGYSQTGPTMSLRGAVKPEEVFGDLLRVMDELDPSGTPTEVGTTLRDEAVAFVKEGYEAGRWTEWADCYKLIEDHDGRDRADEEGMEAFGIHLTDSDSEDDGESDGESDDDDDGAGGGHSAKGLSAKAVDADAGMGDGGELGPDGAGDDDGDGGLRGSGLEVVQHGGAEAAGHSSENGGLSAKADLDKSLAIARATCVV
jgi:hypothetical protein